MAATFREKSKVNCGVFLLHDLIQRLNRHQRDTVGVHRGNRLR